MVAKEVKELQKLRRLAFGAALVGQSAGVIRHPGDVGQLTRTVPGFVGIGVAAKAASAADKLAIPKKRKRKRR